MRRILAVLAAMLLFAAAPALAQQDTAADPAPVQTEESAQAEQEDRSQYAIAPDESNSTDNETQNQQSSPTENNGDLNIPEGSKLDEDGALVPELGGKIRLSIQIPKELEGYNLILNDSEGNRVSESQFDTRGAGSIDISASDQRPTLIINTDRVQKTAVEQRQGFSAAELGLACGAACAASAVLFYFIGRRNGLKIVEGLRDYIHEEKLD